MKFRRLRAATSSLVAHVCLIAWPASFLSASAESVWTLNQGDGTVTQVDIRNKSTRNVALNTPGHGGDIKAYDGLVWTTMPMTPLSLIDARTAKLLCQWQGPGGDSLNVGAGAIWLTDYHAGTVARIAIEDALEDCRRPGENRLHNER